jgi:hypothetical protein
VVGTNKTPFWKNLRIIMDSQVFDLLAELGAKKRASGIV